MVVLKNIVGLGAVLLMIGHQSGVNGQLTVPQQQAAADASVLPPVGQTIDSQAPYYGWSAPKTFQPWSVNTSAVGGVPAPFVYGPTYVFTVNTSVTSTSGGTTYPYILINPANGASIDYTPRRTANTGTFQKILIIWMENQDWTWTESDSNWRQVSELGLTMTNYSAITHPSEPNYAAQWGGDFFGINNDNWFNINATNLSDLMDNAHVTWKSYQEEYVPLPGGACDNNQGIGLNDSHLGLHGSGTQLYQRKHNPPIIFTSVNTNVSRCQNIVSEGQFINDVLNNNLPQVSFYTPNIVNDGHDTDAEGDTRTTSSAFWVKQFLTSYLPYLQQQNVLVQLTFDESDYPNTINTPLYPVANQVVSILYGPSSLITPNTTYSGFINHYGVLDAIEQNFALGSLLRNDSLPANGGQNFFDALNKANQKAGQFYSINATGIA